MSLVLVITVPVNVPNGSVPRRTATANAASRRRRRRLTTVEVPDQSDVGSL